MDFLLKYMAFPIASRPVGHTFRFCRETGRVCLTFNCRETTMAENITDLHFSTIPRDRRFLEDYRKGDHHRFGDLPVTEDEIIKFATVFDPQYFHTSVREAKESVFGGLIASGWHTGSLAMRMLVDHFLPGRAGLGSPGLDALRWLKPVRPGDRLSLAVTILDNRRSRSKPDRGAVTAQVDVYNQQEARVMAFTAVIMMSARHIPDQPSPTTE